MKQKTVSGMLLALLVVSMLTLAFNVQRVRGEPKTWYVDDNGGADFTRIQDAIDAASPGDTIHVYNGTYYENVVVDKTLALVGESKYSTIIDGSGTGNVVDVTSDNLNISQFTIRNSGPDYPDSGIHAHFSNGHNISNNIVTNNKYGIHLYACDRCSVYRNNANDNQIGLYLFSCHDCLMTNNNANNNSHGFLLEQSFYSSAFHNNARNNQYGLTLYCSSYYSVLDNSFSDNEYGLRLHCSDYCYIFGNNINNNEYGIQLDYSFDDTIHHNNLINNTNQAVTISSVNIVWDDGFPSGGNYWSDHVCTGNPSDGSEPYTIDADNIDHYPFQDPDGWLKVHNTDTGEDFAAIQEAIDDPDTLDGHTIFVEAGTYLENVVITKSVSLAGENRETTIIDGNKLGTVICMRPLSRCTISGFTVRNSGSATPNSAIELWSSDNVVANNIVSNNIEGIHVRFGNNIIVGNTVSSNDLMGVRLYDASNNTVVENTVSDNGQVGIISHHSINNDITNNIVSESYFGIWLEDSSGDNVGKNRVSYGHFGLLVRLSESNTISGNVLTNNDDGIHVMWNSVDNKITGNSINGNAKGIYLSGSSGNVIYHNNFINNTKQVDSYDSTNTWDDGYPSGGNYWSDYTGVDVYSGPYQNETGSDGIGDTPYIIDENNQDNYPLVEPWSPVIPASVDLDPDTLNLRSGGQSITCYIELPEDYDVNDIDISTVMFNDVIPAELHPTEIGDYDEDGIADLMVKFDRRSVIELLDVGEVTLTITGEVDGTPLEGTDTIRGHCGYAHYVLSLH